MLISEGTTRRTILFFVFYLFSISAFAEHYSENANTKNSSESNSPLADSPGKKIPAKNTAIIEKLNKYALVKNSQGLELSIANQYNDSVFNYFSAGYNYFNNEQGFEIAVPIVYANLKETVSSRSVEFDSELFNIDVYFRKHRVKYTSPFRRYSYWYIGALARYTYVDGITRDSYFQNINNRSAFVRKSESKFGLGLNVGFRTFFHIGELKFYWGVSVTAGQYVAGDSNVILYHDDYSINDYDDQTFYDIEIAKFGFAF